MLKLLTTMMFSLMYAIQASATTYSLEFPTQDNWALADLGPDCKFKVQLPKNSTFRAATNSNNNYGHAAIIIENLKYFPMTFGFQFACADAEDGFVNKGWALKNPYGDWQENSDESVNQLKRLGAFHFFAIKSKNSNGWAVIADDIYGDEHLRARQMTYCLVHKSKSVCGQSYIGMLAHIKKNPAADYTPKLLQMLQRIEFLE